MKKKNSSGQINKTALQTEQVSALGSHDWKLALDASHALAELMCAARVCMDKSQGFAKKKIVAAGISDKGHPMLWIEQSKGEKLEALALCEALSLGSGASWAVGFVWIARRAVDAAYDVGFTRWQKSLNEMSQGIEVGELQWNARGKLHALGWEESKQLLVSSDRTSDALLGLQKHAKPSMGEAARATLALIESLSIARAAPRPKSKQGPQAPRL